jgi:cell division protein ZapA
MSTRIVHVEIRGHRYAIRSGLDPQYITDLAAHVDGKMTAAAHELSTSDPLRLAVIAALNIADEYFRARDDVAGAETRLIDRAAEIERLVDSALETVRLRAVNE